MSEAGEDISALLDGELAPDEAAAVEARLAASAGAQAERDALGHVVEQVRGLTRVSPPSHFLAAVMAGVIEARPDESASRGASGRLRADRDEKAKRGASGRVSLAGRGEKLACGIDAEDLSAFMDQALPPERQAEVGAKIGGSEPCHARLVELQRVRDRVRGLPRLAPGELFTRQVMARLDEAPAAAPAPEPGEVADPVTLEARAQARAETRATLWRATTWFAQAAGLVLSVGLGLGLTAPRGAGWTPMATPDGSFERRLAARAQASGPPAESSGGVDAAPFAPEGVDARLEFTSKASVAGFEAARNTAANLGSFDDRFVRSPRGEGAPADFVVTLPANRVDDLALAIDATNEVDAPEETRAAIARLTVEQDRVVLKSGFVLAGRLESDGDPVVVVAGDLRQAVPRRAVDRVERADRPRRLWIAVRGEAGR